MAKNRIINTKIYSDPYIRRLDTEEKFLFVYFLTNHLTNICGMYEITKEQIAFDTKISLENIDKILKIFKRDNKILYVDNWICIVNFIKNQSLNPSVMTGIEREVQLVPSKIRRKFISVCDSLQQSGKLNSISTGNKKKKAFYDGHEMRYKKAEKKWYVIMKDGEWKIFAGKKSDIEWK